MEITPRNALVRGGLTSFAGVKVAERLHSKALLLSVRHAFVHGMDAALVVSALIAALAMLLALAFMPAKAPAREAASATVPEVASA